MSFIICKKEAQGHGSCPACDIGNLPVNHYYLGAETKSGKKVQVKVGKKTYDEVMEVMKKNPGAKLIIED